MNLLQKMNLTIKHIENNLTSQIDYSELAKYVMCSVYHYQRMFSFIAGVSLGEYIRRRRLTSAAFDLQNGEEQIIEIALKYGYESPESFSRAFKQLHGVTPTSARNGGVILKSFPPISFQISIKGAIEMNYRIENLDEFQVVGLTKKVNQTNILEKNKPYNEIMEMWNRAFEEKLFDKLWDLKKEERPIKGILGVFSDGNWGNNDYSQKSMGCF